MSVVQANRIIMHPHITERTFELASNESRICLIVSRDATKTQIVEAVSVLYKERPVGVNTAHTIYGKKAFVKFADSEKARDLATKMGML
ncbi:MAG: 50S ribosomal protein L23 [Thaumarchaeota archaeon]|nr:50S ribosomal protein L23 [Nitrososphaerota archaeon]